MMAVDAFVEIMHADGTTNPCTASDLGLDKGPVAVPIGSGTWTSALRAWRIHEHNEVNPRLTVRVIDTDGVVVEAMAEVILPCTCGPTNNVVTALSGLSPLVREARRDQPLRGVHGCRGDLRCKPDWKPSARKNPVRSSGPDASIVQALPARWFALPAKVRCTSDHVATTSDPHDFIAGHCRTCGAPVALTFPEDCSGPLRA